MVPGPGARTFWAKIMRQFLFHGPGGPSELRIVDCGMRIEKEKPKIRNPQFEIRNGRADAFCPEAPCLRSTTQASRNCQILCASLWDQGSSRMKLFSLGVLNPARAQEKSDPGDQGDKKDRSPESSGQIDEPAEDHGHNHRAHVSEGRDKAD